MAQQMAGQLATASETIAKVVHHARLAGDERMVARSALGMASTRSTALPRGPGDRRMRSAHHGRLRRSPGANLIMCKVAQLQAMVGDYERRGRTSSRPARCCATWARPCTRPRRRSMSRSSNCSPATLPRPSGRSVPITRCSRHRRDLFPLDHGGHAGACGAGAGPRRGSADLDRTAERPPPKTTSTHRPNPDASGP